MWLRAFALYITTGVFLSCAAHNLVAPDCGEGETATFAFLAPETPSEQGKGKKAVQSWSRYLAGLYPSSPSSRLHGTERPEPCQGQSQEYRQGSGCQGQHYKHLEVRGPGKCALSLASSCRPGSCSYFGPGGRFGACHVPCPRSELACNAGCERQVVKAMGSSGALWWKGRPCVATRSVLHSVDADLSVRVIERAGVTHTVVSRCAGAAVLFQRLHDGGPASPGSLPRLGRLRLAAAHQSP